MRTPFEYFCHTCKQLRLSLRPDRVEYACGNCGSLLLTKGAVGQLDKWDVMDMYGSDVAHDGEDR